MKKYKIHFSIVNLVGSSQKEVVALQNRAKLFMGVLTGSTWWATNADCALIVGFAGILLDTLIACFYFEELGAPNAEPGREGGC